VIGLVRAEMLKIRTTRVLLWLALLILALSAFVVSVTVASTGTVDLARQSEQRSIVQFAAVSAVVSTLMGIVLTAGEYVHGTIDHTFLVTPARERVVAAKLLAGGLAGAALAAFAELVAWSITAAWISSKPVPFELATRPILTAYLGILAAAALSGALGVGLGALLRRQTAAIVLTLIWLLIAEPVLAVAGVEAYAPGHAIAAVVAAGGGGGNLLGVWAGLLLSLGYVAGFGAAGTYAVVRADVT
jgi:ABC-2 type transport system permease protein